MTPTFSKPYSPRQLLAKVREYLPWAAASFDHLVGELLELPRHFQAERFRGSEVDYKLEFGWPFNGKLAHVCAGENSINVAGSPLKAVEHCRAVPGINAWLACMGREGVNLRELLKNGQEDQRVKATEAPGVAAAPSKVVKAAYHPATAPAIGSGAASSSGKSSGSANPAGPRLFT